MKITLKSETSVQLHTVHIRNYIRAKNIVYEMLLGTTTKIATKNMEKMTGKNLYRGIQKNEKQNNNKNARKMIQAKSLMSFFFHLLHCFLIISTSSEVVSSFKRCIISVSVFFSCVCVCV